MKRTQDISLSLAAVALLAGLPILKAITYGFADTDDVFSNVGAFIVRSPTTGNIFPICTGTLIAPGVFLTASHCTVFYENDLATRGFEALVSFSNSIPFGDLTSRRTRLIAVSRVVSNPGYNQRESDPGDIAVLLLPQQATRGIIPAVLPTANLLDLLVAQHRLQGAVLTAVGYGLQDRVVGGGVPFFQDINPIPRMYAFSGFHSLSGAFLRLSQNPSLGFGGTCFGDSGGPNFLPVNGVRMLVAITITGDAVCRATNTTYRVDISSARAFLAPYVTLP